jgi:hypothetical protein
LLKFFETGDLGADLGFEWVRGGWGGLLWVGFQEVVVVKLGVLISCAVEVVGGRVSTMAVQ